VESLKKKSLDELFKQGIAFLKGKGRFLLIHHKDADGLCSAAVFLKVAKSLGVEPTKVVASSNEEAAQMLDEMRSFERIVILDIDISYLKKELDDSEKSMLIIDHHPPRQDLSSEKIVYINPRLLDPSVYQPVSYLMWKMFSKVANIREAEWMAALGTIADLGFEDCKDLIEKFTDSRRKYDLPKTVIWKDAEMLDGYMAERGYADAMKLILKFKSFDEFRKDGEVKAIYERFSERYGTVEKMFWRNAKEMKEINLLISEIDSDDRVVSSLLSTNLALERPGMVVIIMRKTDGMYAINARCQREDINLGDIMIRSADDLNGGGGHANAAGGTIKERNGTLFRERVIKELGSLSAKKS
jgi:single-stranded DNA-specific DHH superfamily exonuclease